MTDFATEVARYQELPPEDLERMAKHAGEMMRHWHARHVALRRAQRRQATLAKGGKLPQHTRTP